MVGPAPRIAEVMPAFLEWAGDAVFVAHNAPFDIGFLRAACTQLELPWPQPRVLDTVTLARAALLRDEVPNRRLSTLASYFGSPEQPVHRALADARATVHVMHCLFERLGSSGISTIDEVLELKTVIKPEQRKKRSLAENLPEKPGVYIFHDDRQRALYVGKSRNVRKRAMSYFTRSETRERMNRMLNLAHGITAIECHTELEARIRELRIIREVKPPFNAVGKRPERTIWIRVTREPYPRLSAVREVRADKGSLHFGPVPNMEEASLVIDAITSVIPLRVCTPRLSISRPTSSCALADMNRCSAPCELRITPSEYAILVDALNQVVAGDSRIETDLQQRLDHYVANERFEEAALIRDRMFTWIATAARFQKLVALTSIEEMVAAAPHPDHGWDIHVIRYGSLAAAGWVASPSEVTQMANSLKQIAMNVPTPQFPAPALSVTEARIIDNWLRLPGVRLLDTTAGWASPYPSHLHHQQEITQAYQARSAAASLAALPKRMQFTAPK
jgi:DNA polymerase-3 subunit epsilon